MPLVLITVLQAALVKQGAHILIIKIVLAPTAVVVNVLPALVVIRLTVVTKEQESPVQLVHLIPQPLVLAKDQRLINIVPVLVVLAVAQLILSTTMPQLMAMSGTEALGQRPVPQILAKL